MTLCGGLTLCVTCREAALECALQVEEVAAPTSATVLLGAVLVRALFLGAVLTILPLSTCLPLLATVSLATTYRATTPLMLLVRVTIGSFA